MFLVYGEDYKRIRDQIARESLQRNLQQEQEEVSDLFCDLLCKFTCIIAFHYVV